MKKNIIPVFIIGLLITLAGRKETPQTERAEKAVDDAAKQVSQAVDNTVDKVKEKIEENFVANALKTNAEEIEWLRAGTKMGANPELIRTAEEMISDHEKIASDIRAYAAAKRLELDDYTSQSIKIDSKTGANWDKNWAEKIKKMHRDMVDKFERIQSNTEDADLKTLATNSLPLLRNHLNMAEQLEAKLDAVTSN